MDVPNIASHFCVKTAIIALEKFLNLDCILTARTAPGHSHHNAAEKINCRLNLGLYNIGVMKKSSIDLKFEHKLKNCSHLSDVHKLVHESPEKNWKLLDESWKPSTQLIKDQFSCLQLKRILFESLKRNLTEILMSYSNP